MRMKCFISFSLICAILSAFGTEQDGKILDISDYLPLNCRRDGPFYDRDRSTVFEYIDPSSGEKVASERLSKGRISELQLWLHGKLNGTQREWHENRRKKSISTYKNGVMDGEFRIWDLDGQLVSNYVMTRGSGIKKVYYSDGRLKVECRFENNLEEGMSVERFGNGRIEFISYSKGELSGEGHVFNKEGKLVVYSCFNKMGKPHGSFIELDEQEKIISFKRYLNGLEVSEETYQKEAPKDKTIRDIDRTNFTLDVIKDIDTMKLYSNYNGMPPVKIPLELHYK